MKYARIGCGMISPNHIKAALETGLEIAALCDLSEENRNRALELIPADKRGGVRLYGDYHVMLAETRPELAAIALGSGLKKRISVDCMRAGANVIVEKPIALSLSEADEMIAAAKENGVWLCVNHQLRFGRTVRALKAEVDAGRFGKLFHGTVQIRRNRNKAYFDAGKWRGTWAQDGGTLMNQCIHYTDLLQWLMGDVEEVFAYTDRLAHPYTEAEDMGLALVKFKNGAYGMIEGTVNVYPRNLSDSLALFGEAGTASLEGKTLDDVKAWNFADGPQSRDEALSAFGVTDMGGGHAPVYRDMTAAIRENREPLCSAAEGRKALELILAIYKSRKTGLPVRLPLADFASVDMEGVF
ncbi:MAG: Gfo/Idh/MocA family oxidoreductase [Oscillospiraceae bacterium]|nr:Gfo/Idh/MocA family oxidoreductase [Oscillospiraceae bacterium]